MLGLMQNRPLLISGIADYVEQLHSDREIVSRDPDGVVYRTNYGEIVKRAKRLAGALIGFGSQQGDRVATLAWNSYRHLEIYYGVTCSGLVLHTVNPRLFPEHSCSTSCTTLKMRMFASTRCLLSSSAPLPRICRW